MSITIFLFILSDIPGGKGGGVESDTPNLY